MNDYYGYGLIDPRSHAAYERLHRLLNREYPRVGRCEWCGVTGRRTGYAVAEPGRYSLSRADWVELCNRCHIYYDGVHRPLAASPRSERELETLYARRMEPYGRIMNSRGPISPARRALPPRPRPLDAQQYAPGCDAREQ